jgi:uncharacterized protein (TIGR03437 family)
MRLRSVIPLTTVLSCSAWGQTYTISTFAGGGQPGLLVDIPGTSASLGPNAPQYIAADRAGNVLFAFQNTVLRLDATTGVLTLVAGNGTTGFSGDNGPATSAQLNSPAGVAVDSAGNVYIADSGNNRIRKVSGGVIATVAGNGTPGFSGDTGPATSAQLNGPAGLAVDSAGDLYIADHNNFRIRMVSNGVIATVAGDGTGGSSGDDIPATSAQLYPSYLAVDSAGNLYIASTFDTRIRQVANGVITTLAGNGTAGFSGDNGPATSAQLFSPAGVAVDSAGNLYIADTNNHRVRKVANGVITTVAGNGNGGFSGDSGPATNAQLYFPAGIAVDAAGNLYIADTFNYRIRKVSGGAITTVAGNGIPGFSGDNGPATSAQLNSPQGVAIDSAGNLYIADALDNRIRKVSAGVITTVAGGGSSFGDNVLATSACLDFPRGVAVDSAGNLYLADTMNGLIREVSNGVIGTVAGNRMQGFAGDNGPATSAPLYFPDGVAVDSAGNLYIADTNNNRIRKVSNGVITTVAGNGTPGFSGDNGPATSAQLSGPSGIAVDAAGNVYFTDANRVRKISNGVVSTVAGNGTQGFNGDNIPAPSAQLEIPRGIAVDSAGSLYIAETNRIRKVSNGVIATIAGNGTWGFSGDNGPATNAQVFGSPSVAVDSAGNVYIADSGNNRVRLLTPLPTIKSVVNAASFVPGAVSPGELVTIFGTGIGPVTAASATTDPSTGKLATMIGGVQVLFNGIAAPMIYASSTQVSAVVPYEMATVPNPSVSINFGGQTSNTDQLSLATAAPGLFAQNASGSGAGAILNQDNSLNGPGHSAAKGSIVQVYLTGEGQTTPQGVTGKITTATLPPPQVTPAPVQVIGVSIGGQPAVCTYAGEAPGMVAGVMQLNVRIPANAPSGPLSILVSIGGNMSQNGITVTVQ